MSLLEEILNDYLYFEQVQRLARDLRLPVSRTKDQLVGEVIASDDVDLSEVVSFLYVWQLQQICEEIGVPSGADRQTLAGRVLTALEAERQPKPRRRRARPTASLPQTAAPPPPTAPSHPVNDVPVEARPAPTPVTFHVSLPPTPAPDVYVTVPPTPPPEIHVHVPETSRASWAFAGIIMAVVFAGATPLAIYALGVVVGAIVAIGAGVVAAFALLFTAKRWTDWIDRTTGRS